MRDKVRRWPLALTHGVMLCTRTDAVNWCQGGWVTRMNDDEVNAVISACGVI